MLVRATLAMCSLASAGPKCFASKSKRSQHLRTVEHALCPGSEDDCRCTPKGECRRVLAHNTDLRDSKLAAESGESLGDEATWMSEELQRMLQSSMDESGMVPHHTAVVCR